MIRFDIITIFPELLNCYLNESLIKKAQERGLIKAGVHNLRNWTKDLHHTVDDKPYGGGFGMVMKAPPVYNALNDITKLQLKGKKIKAVNKKTKIIVFTPRGKKFTQKMASRFSRCEQIIFLCGRYEGIDERIAKNMADIELSIGEFDLMGGELPAMIVIESVSRLIPGVISKPELLQERIGKEKGFFEYAQYTRPEIFSPKPGINWRVPKNLLCGDPKKINAWRLKHGKYILD